MKNISIDKEKLIDLIESGLTIFEISKEMTISIATIRRRMIEYKLKPKSIEFKYIEIECYECHKKFRSLKL